MKQRIWIVIVSVLMFVCISDVHAQRHKTKCPPGKSFFKADKKARKRAGVSKNHPQPKVFYKPQEADVRTVKSGKANASTEKNANWYIDSKKHNRKLQKVDKSVASTKCPGR